MRAVFMLCCLRPMGPIPCRCTGVMQDLMDIYAQAIADSLSQIDMLVKYEFMSDAWLERVRSHLVMMHCIGLFKTSFNVPWHYFGDHCHDILYP